MSSWSSAEGTLPRGRLYWRAIPVVKATFRQTTFRLPAVPAEMSAPDRSRELDVLAALSHRTNLPVGCYCEEESRCHRFVLRELLAERGGGRSAKRAAFRMAADVRQYARNVRRREGHFDSSAFYFGARICNLCRLLAFDSKGGELGVSGACCPNLWADGCRNFRTRWYRVR